MHAEASGKTVQLPVDCVDESGAGVQVVDGSSGDPVLPSTGRYRLHRATARTRVIKVLYADDELGAVCQAAEQAGLRPSSYVAAAALAHATSTAAPAGDRQDRELLAELLQARLAVRQYGVNVNQVAAALNAGVGQAPAWLGRAADGADRAVARIDEAAGQLSRRLA